jgi:hypothetical protein
MKKELLAAVVAVLLLLAGVGYYGFSWLAEPRPRKYVELPPLPKELREMEKQLAADNKGGAKGQIAPADLPPEILKLIKELLPDAVITEAVRDKKDKFKLKLAWNGKTLIASLRFTDRDVRGDIKENLNPQDLPAAIAAAFKQAAPAARPGTSGNGAKTPTPRRRQMAACSSSRMNSPPVSCPWPLRSL